MTLLLVLSCSIAFGQIDFFDGLDSREFSVGFQQNEIANTGSNESGDLKISIWYPANESSEESLKFSDYLNQRQIGKRELSELLASKIGGEFAPDSLDMILESQTLAVKNATPIDKRFPLIMWSARNETIEYQWLISEYLASNGYVVAYVEDIPPSPFPWGLPSTDEKEASLDQHLSNIKKAMTYLSNQQNIDPTKTGIISWSYAGESAILAQQNNPSVQAVIGLSSIGFTSGVYLGSEFEKRVELEKLNVPYLIQFEKTAPNGNERAIPEIFSSLHPNSRYVFFESLAHGSFNTIEGMIPGVLDTNKVQSWSRGGKAAKFGFEAICKLTQRFLDSTLKQTGKFNDGASQIIDELPLGFLTIHTPSKN